MPYIFVEEVPEGTEAVDVVSVEEVQQMKARLDELEDMNYSLAENVAQANENVEKWKRERDEAREKYAKVMMAPSFGAPKRADGPDEIVSGDIFA